MQSFVFSLLHSFFGMVLKAGFVLSEVLNVDDGQHWCLKTSGIYRP